MSFSKKFTWINILASTVGYVVWGLWLFSNFDWFLTLHLDWHLVGTYLSIHLAVLVSSILLTALFLHTDKLCCCCCNPREQLSVYDPDLDKRFIKIDDKLVEDSDDDGETPEDDIETDTNSTVPDTEGDKTNSGEQIEMAKLVPVIKEEENLNMEGGEATEAPDDDEKI